MRSAGSGSMITPVENGRIWSASQPRWLASASHTCMARANPSFPVPALAFPVLTTSAWTSLRRCCFASTTGAAQKRFWVNTPATVVPAARRMTSRSLRLALRTPAMATPSSTPGTGCSAAGAGAGRLTATINRLSGQLAVAVLVFLARAARTGIVAAHLLRMPHRRLRLLLGRRLGDRYVAVARVLRLRFLHSPGARMLRPNVLHVGLVIGLDVILGANLDRGQRLDDLELDRLDHGAEQLERLALVFLLRVFLRVAAQVDALAQVVECRQVLAPVRIEDLQHDVALVLAERSLGAGRQLGVVGRLRLLDDAREQSLVLQVGFGFKPAAQRQLEVELGLERGFEAGDVPLLLDAFVGNVHAEHVVQHAAAQVGDARRDIARLEHLVPQGIDGPALVVADVVVLEQLLADVEVPRFDFSLRALDRARHHGMLDRLAFGHLQHHHDAVDALAGEDAQQRVLERHVEARAAPVALPP